MSALGDSTVDAIVEGGRFVGVVRLSGRIIWHGEPRTTKLESLTEAQQHMTRDRVTQDDRDSQQFTMDLAASLAEPSWADDGVLGL